MLLSATKVAGPLLLTKLYRLSKVLNLGCNYQGIQPQTIPSLIKRFLSNSPPLEIRKGIPCENARSILMKGRLDTYITEGLSYEFNFRSGLEYARILLANFCIQFQDTIFFV